MCVLRADGKDFAVDEFLKKSSLKPSLIYCKGNIQTDSRIYDSSGFNVAISNAEFDDLESQIKDAIDFLKKKSEELERLLKFENVETVTIDFAISTPSENIIVWTRSFPKELLKLMCSLEIELDFTVYPKSY